MIATMLFGFSLTMLIAYQNLQSQLQDYLLHRIQALALFTYRTDIVTAEAKCTDDIHPFKRESRASRV
jgi:hypothetical protein